MNYPVKKEYHDEFNMNADFTIYSQYCPHMGMIGFWSIVCDTRGRILNETYKFHSVEEAIAATMNNHWRKIAA